MIKTNKQTIPNPEADKRSIGLLVCKVNKGLGMLGTNNLITVYSIDFEYGAPAIAPHLICLKGIFIDRCPADH